MPAIGDNPIQEPEHDLLGRSSLAESFTRQILDADASEGLVVGVLGPWGSGKTSFLNLVREHLKANRVPVLEFNPWMFSGTEHLVQSFFAELSIQLRLRRDLSDIGKSLERYGELLTFVPIVGVWAARGAAISRTARRMHKRQQRGGGLEATRSKLRAALQERQSPIVVVLDDLDRLSDSEVRDLFKLVRLNAQFPYIVYLVAFDWHRVEQALGESEGYGQAYLSKIVQIPLDLPIIHRSVIEEQIMDAIGSVLATVPSVEVPEDQILMPTLRQVISPLCQNIRDVRRYAASMRSTMEDLAGQVALIDVLTLEAFRILRPSVFTRLTDSVEALTTTADALYSLDDSKELRLGQDIKGLLESSQNSRDQVYNMINLLFPAASRYLHGPTLGRRHSETWLKECRVANRDILGLYLERVANTGLKSFTAAEQALALMSDHSEFENWLYSLEPSSFSSCMASLRLFSKDFVSSHVVPASTVLLNVLDSFAVDEKGRVDAQLRIAIDGIVLDLLNVLESEENVEAAVGRIVSELHTISTRLELIQLIGYRELIGYRLVTIEAAERFEEQLRSEIKELSAEQLIEERELLALMAFQFEAGGDSESGTLVPDTPTMTCALLNAVQLRMYEGRPGHRAILMSDAPTWNTLAAICGGPEAFRRRVDAARHLVSGELFGMLELADDWLSSQE